MADGILGLHIHLGKSQTACFVGCKDRVVAEAFLPHLFAQNLSFDNAMEQMFLTIEAESYSGVELGTA